MSEPKEAASRDGFAQDRAGEGVLPQELDGEQIPLILRHRDVRAAAKDWETFSSDAPFRVPIPAEEHVRSVRQIPIELDPPRHTAYRRLIEPWFLRPTKADYIARIDALVATIIDELQHRGETEITSEFALPLQSRALAILLEMPESEADLWIGWGNSLYREGDGAAKGKQLDAYFRRQFERVRNDQHANDFFAYLSRLKLDGKPLSDDELCGIANLAFAGGRDTVINAIAEVVACFARNPEIARRIVGDQRLVHGAVEELVRWTSPLSFIGRVCPVETAVGSHLVPPDGRVALCWASANYDTNVFANPAEFQPERRPNPHMGFGSGKHTCLGAAHARSLLRILIKRLAPISHDLRIIEEVPATESIGEVRRRIGFERLRVCLEKGEALSRFSPRTT